MQLWLAGQAAHAAPRLPHSLLLCAVVTHPVPLQQPCGHDVALQATHAPLAQTSPVPQGFPSLMLVGMPHTGPLVHDIVPCWHGLPVGVHGACAVHAAQVPCPSHTPLDTELVSHGVPGDAGVFWSVHANTPPVHDVTFPTWQGLPGGEHESPT
jgi:hypothetical protein